MLLACYLRCLLVSYDSVRACVIRIALHCVELRWIALHETHFFDVRRLAVMFGFPTDETAIRAIVASTMEKSIGSPRSKLIKTQVFEDFLFKQAGLDPTEPDFDIKVHDAKHKREPVVATELPPTYGVCDTPEQFARRYASFYKAPAECVVHFCEVRRSAQPSYGGWKWRKRGKYVGDYLWQKAGIEDLFEANGRRGRPRIDVQYTFSLVEPFNEEVAHFSGILSAAASYLSKETKKKDTTPPPPTAGVNLLFLSCYSVCWLDRLCL